MKHIPRLLFFLVLIFLYLPLLVIIVFSFNTSTHSLIWHGFSLKWYNRLFHDPALSIIATHSFFLAICSAFFSSTLGLCAGLALVSKKQIMKKALHRLVLFAVVIPDILIAICLLIFYRLTHFPLGFWSLCIAHCVLCTPFATITLHMAAQKIHTPLIFAGRDLGASESQILRYIIVPLLLPALCVSFLLCFTLSLDDALISYFVAGPNFDILPLHIYSAVRLGIKPEINALCSLLFISTTIIILTSQLIRRRALS